jgi:hypothetical protein
MVLTGVRNWRPGILIAVCVVILLVSPPLRELSNYESYWVDDEFEYDPAKLDQILLGFVLNGYFPLLPWLLFPLAGFALGQLYFPNEAKASLPRILPLFGAVLIALAALGVLLHSHVPNWIADYYATGWPDGFDPVTSVLVLGALGGMMICLWILNHTIDLNPSVSGTGPVLTFFRRYSLYSLSAYVAHLAVQLWPMWIAAWWEQKSSVTFYEGRFLSLPVALASAVAFIALFYVWLAFLDRGGRKYSLEHFMRWICS